MTQTLLSAAGSARRGEKLPMLMQRCAATRHAVAGRIQWHRHSCSPRGTKGLCAFIKPSTQRVAHRVTSQPGQLLIANLELKLHSTHRKTSPLKIPNRKFSRVLRSPWRTAIFYLVSYTRTSTSQNGNSGPLALTFSRKPLTSSLASLRTSRRRLSLATSH